MSSDRDLIRTLADALDDKLLTLNRAAFLADAARARLTEPDTAEAVILAAKEVLRWRYDEPGRQPTLSMDTLRQCIAAHAAAQRKEGTWR